MTKQKYSNEELGDIWLDMDKKEEKIHAKDEIEYPQWDKYFKEIDNLK